MIKKFFALLCLCTLCIGSAWGAEETYTFSSFISAQSVELKATNFTITLSKNSGQTNPQWNNSSSEARVYAKGSLTVSSEVNITKIVYNYVVNANNKGKKPTISSVKGSNSDGTWNETNKTWTGSDDKIVFDTSGEAGNVGFTSITVTYENTAPARTLQSIYIDGTATELEYTEGESFDPTGLKVMGKYDDELGDAEITSGITWSFEPEVFALGNTSVAVIAKHGDFTSAAFTVNNIVVNGKPALPSYILVSDASTLKAGDIIVIGATKDDNSYVAGALSGDYLTSEDATIKNSILLASKAVEFTLGGEAGSWTLTSSEGTLGATTVKKLTYDNTKENFVDTWTISIDDGSATISSTGVSSTGEGYGRFLYNVNNPRFLTYTSNTSASMLLPQIYRKEVSAKITSTGYATFSSDCALDLSNLPEGLTAYKATTAGNDKVHMVAVEEAVAANTGLFLKGDAGETYAIPVAASGTALDDNILKATTGEALAEGDYVYVIESGAFQPLGKATVVSKGKAYIPASAITTSGKLEISFGESTGITSYENENENENIYNLNGVRVNSNYKGIVIMNGKKYINK